jgi:hypothetical protein
VIHADNAIPHCAKTVAQFLDHNSLRRALHAPDSSDLAPFKFWLFGYLKGVLQGSSFDKADELLLAIQEMLSGFDRESLDAIFQEWMILVQKCIDGNCEYVQ